MFPCRNCKKNNWKFKKMDGVDEIEATCKKCGNVISWKLPVKEKWEVGKPCVKCKGEVKYFNSPFNPKKLKKAYYYSGYYRCIKCKQCYFSDKFKIVNEEVCKKNIQETLNKFQ